MLIFRYLFRELIASTLAVSVALLLVVVSSRFVKYLAEASTGKLDASILFAVMGYRTPEFLVLIIPLGFFFGILLSYGRLYIENEMTVLSACGMSQGRLVGYTLVAAVGVALLVGWLSVIVSPAGLEKSESLLNAQKQRAEIENILPKQFLVLADGRGMTYTDEVTKEGELRQLFFAERARSQESQERLALVVAEKAYQLKTVQEQPGYLILENGYRIEGTPGEADYILTRFSEYGQRLVMSGRIRKLNADALPTVELWGVADNDYRAALQWRFSVPVLVLVVSLMAIPLSKTDPRQGRFNKLVPAVLLYIVYLIALNGMRSAIEEGSVASIAGLPLGLWSVHLAFILLTVAMLAFPRVKQKLMRRQQLAEVRGARK